MSHLAIVSSEPYFRRMLCDLLKLDKHDVDEVEGHLPLLEYLLAAEEVPPVIVVDGRDPDVIESAGWMELAGRVDRGEVKVVYACDWREDLPTGAMLVVRKGPPIRILDAIKQQLAAGSQPKAAPAKPAARPASNSRPGVSPPAAGSGPQPVVSKSGTAESVPAIKAAQPPKPPSDEEFSLDDSFDGIEEVEERNPGGDAGVFNLDNDLSSAIAEMEQEALKSIESAPSQGVPIGRMKAKDAPVVAANEDDSEALHANAAAEEPPAPPPPREPPKIKPLNLNFGKDKKPARPQSSPAAAAPPLNNRPISATRAELASLNAIEDLDAAPARANAPGPPPPRRPPAPTRAIPAASRAPDPHNVCKYCGSERIDDTDTHCRVCGQAYPG